jgi:hypothetical protein
VELISSAASGVAIALTMALLIREWRSARRELAQANQTSKDSLHKGAMSLSPNTPSGRWLSK